MIGAPERRIDPAWLAPSGETMSMLLKFLGLGGASDAAGAGGSLGRIAQTLDHLEPEKARFFAAFAYVLARVAGADLTIDVSEKAAMQESLTRLAGISDKEAALVVDIAGAHMHDLGGTENFIVTREFRRLSDRAQRIRLIECLCAVAAADDRITSDESAEILGIAEEIGLAREEALAIRSGWRDKLAELRKLPGEERS
jgi:uncharacterized tellurite resistance protein B-like protein